MCLCLVGLLRLFVLNVDLRICLCGFVLIRWCFSCCGVGCVGFVWLGFGLILWCFCGFVVVVLLGDLGVY